MAQSAQQKRKEIYRYDSPWALYAMNWSVRPDQKFRIALGSFIEEYNNKVQIVQLDEDAGEFRHTAHFDHPYPATKIMWIPDIRGQYTDLLATSADYLRIFRVSEDGATMECLLNNNRSSEFCAPLSSFDWNENDVGIIGTASIDTTCTIWRLETGQMTGQVSGTGSRVSGHVKTQLIAHDKEVYDFAFSKSVNQKDVFASVGADGSVRMFDLRHLEHSTIIYEDPLQTPLLRIAWNKQDPFYIATVASDSTEVVIILDIRLPCAPVARLNNHRAFVNGIVWAPHSSCHICTAADDHQALIWDVQAMPRAIEDPILAYTAGGEINQVHWAPNQPDWIAICFNNCLEILRCAFFRYCSTHGIGSVYLLCSTRVTMPSGLRAAVASTPVSIAYRFCTSVCRTTESGRMQRNHFIRYGVPFIGFVVCGSLGLQFFTSIRLEYRKVFASRKLFTSLGIDPSKQKSLEQIYEAEKREEFLTFVRFMDPTKGNSTTGGDDQTSQSELSSSAPQQLREELTDPLHEELLNSLVALGFSPVVALSALSQTGFRSVEEALDWILEQQDSFSSYIVDSEEDEVSNISETMAGYKMVCVVNTSLKMGVGKTAAQVGHAVLGLYRLMNRQAIAEKALTDWTNSGQMKVVLKGEDSQHLESLEVLADARRLNTYLVHDAGRTQVAPGSVTVLAIFGPVPEVDEITGQLRLL
ncbi:DDB1- and CUL4-associated factor 7 [Trichinella sp. T9]|nr:DDB1- and CUL4-associated factor 7 [Trichinella sp. T9]